MSVRQKPEPRLATTDSGTLLSYFTRAGSNSNTSAAGTGNDGANSNSNSHKHGALFTLSPRLPLLVLGSSKPQVHFTCLVYLLYFMPHVVYGFFCLCANRHVVTNQFSQTEVRCTHYTTDRPLQHRRVVAQDDAPADSGRQHQPGRERRGKQHQ